MGHITKKLCLNSENVRKTLAMRWRVRKLRCGKGAQYLLVNEQRRVGMSDVFRSTDVTTRGNQPSRQTSVLFSNYPFGQYISKEMKLWELNQEPCCGLRPRRLHNTGSTMVPSAVVGFCFYCVLYCVASGIEMGKSLSESCHLSKFIHSLWQ